MTKSTHGRIARRFEKRKFKMKFNSGGIKRVLDWSHAVCPYEGPIGRGDDADIPAVSGMTNLQVLAKLIVINGFTPKVTKYGFHSGPLGLSQAEAHLLMELGPYFQGLLDGAGVAAESAANMLKPLLESWAVKWEMQGAAADEAAGEDGEPTEGAAVDQEPAA